MLTEQGFFFSGSRERLSQELQLSVSRLARFKGRIRAWKQQMAAVLFRGERERSPFPSSPQLSTTQLTIEARKEASSKNLVDDRYVLLSTFQNFCILQRKGQRGALSPLITGHRLVEN